MVLEKGCQLLRAEKYYPQEGKKEEKNLVFQVSLIIRNELIKFNKKKGVAILVTPFF